MGLGELTKNINKEIRYIERGDDKVGEKSSSSSSSSYSKTKSFLFRYTVRPILNLGVNKVHSGLKGRYDKEIYRYDDPRLLFLDKLTKDFIKENIKDKSDIMLLNKIVDICLGIVKEDIYYRVRGFILLNRYMEENVRFIHTSEEQKLL